MSKDNHTIENVFVIVQRKPYEKISKNHPYMSSLKKFVTEIENFEIFFGINVFF
jgi:hypothetical protein